MLPNVRSCAPRVDVPSSATKEAPLPTSTAGAVTEPINVDGTDNSAHHDVSAQPLWLVLSSKLRSADAQLPPAVPLGLLTDALASITGNPTHGVVDIEEAWEEDWNPTLHRVFGYDTPAEDLVGLVRRGGFGLEGLGDWVEAIGQAGVGVEMLRERIERLLKAVDIVYVLSVGSFVPYTDILRLAP